MANTYVTTMQASGTTAALGHTLYGTCTSYSRDAEKLVTMNEFDGVEPGIHITVYFLNPCKPVSGLALKVGTAAAYPVVGPCYCAAGETISFVYEASGHWRAIGHYVVASDATPEDIGVASAGTSNDYARADHTHAIDVSLVAELVEGDFISKDIINEPFDIFYASDRDTISSLAANNTTTKKYLRSVGISQNVEEDGQTVTRVSTTAPVWEAITASDVGLGNVTNHKQVTDVTYDRSTGAVVVTKGEDTPVTLFTLGANAFLSTAYLPLDGGTLLGPLVFSMAANSVVWENASKDQRLVVTESASPENAVFTFQQENAGSWTNLMVIRGNSNIVASAFIGSLTGNADTASKLLHEALTTATINDTSGSFAFSGSGAPFANHNWVGLQVGDDHLKFQIANEGTNFQVRTYNGSAWSNWGILLNENSITSGDNNGQIKVGDTNISVTGLGALAFEDTLPASGLPDMSDIYVTLTTDQAISGIKTFANILFAAPTGVNRQGILFQGTTDSAAVKYGEQNGLGSLRITMTSQDNTPIEFGWRLTRPAGSEISTEQVVHQFTASEYILNPVREANNTYNSISIRPSIAENGTIGTSVYKWAQMYAVEFYGALKGNADTATKALQDTNGLQIDTNYLKLSGGMMTGVLATQHPINQILEHGGFTDALDSGVAASPNRYKPLKWVFNANITPSMGDIITIRTPSNGHDYGIYLSTDNGTTYYPITLNNGDAMVDQYPAGTCLTLIFDNLNSANGIYSVLGGDNKTTITGGTWRVINYYDSGAPYGIRVYKQNTSLNNEFPILMSQLTFNQINETPYQNNVYALMNADSSKVPTINPYTGVITAAAFHGPMDGTATSANEFSIPTTVELTGVVTGISAASTRGWVVPTTIAEGSIINDMIYGGITRDKLEIGVVKVYTEEESLLISNIDSVAYNGFFPLSPVQQTLTMGGSRPYIDKGFFLSLTSPDYHSVMQFAGNGQALLIRSAVSDTRASLTNTDWRYIVLEDAMGIQNHSWAISITGMADSATKDGDGNIITQYYATNTRVNELLTAADALMFKGILDSDQEYDDDGRKIYRNLPTAGYSAGWTYKVNNNATYAGQVCEIGDLVIAITDGPVTGNQVRPQDWTVAQANLESAITGTGARVVDKSFAIFETTSGKVVRDTGNYLKSLDHTDALAGINKVGSLDGLWITGYTYSNSADMVSNVADQMSFGDGGPQIWFTDDDTTGAIIYNRHINNSGMDAAFNFVTSGGYTAIKTDGLVAHSKVAIGVANVDSTAALKVIGVSDLQGTLIIRDRSAAHSLSLDFVDNKCVFVTQDSLAFGNDVFVSGNIYPTTNNYYTLGYGDQSQPLTWHAVYIGSSLSYGSNNQPIWWNEGIPTPLTYTPNRLYYAPVAESGATFNTGEAYMPGNHYIDSTKLAINYSQGAPQETLYVNGNARIDGTIASNSDILPSVDGSASLGTPSVHWGALYVGDSNSYGDIYTPVYWNNGVPAVVSVVQKASFTLAANSTTCNINKAAYTTNTIVLQIVITSGKENLTSSINWEAGNSNVQLTMATAPKGAVSGYILTARGVNLD